MLRKVPMIRIVMIGIVFAISMFLVTQSTWATEEESVVAPWANEWEEARTWQDYDGNPSFGPCIPCEQVDDLSGRWTARLKRLDKDGGGWWAGCRMEISSGGIIEQGKCINRQGQKALIKKGRLKLSPGCVIRGKINTSKGILYVLRGAIKEKRLLLGVVKAPDDEFERDYLEEIVRHNPEDNYGVLVRLQKAGKITSDDILD